MTSVSGWRLWGAIRGPVASRVRPSAAWAGGAMIAASASPNAAIPIFICLKDDFTRPVRLMAQSSYTQLMILHWLMPELPEVETTRRGIDAIITGQTLSRLVVHEPRMRWPIPPELPSLIGGRT